MSKLTTEDTASSAHRSELEAIEAHLARLVEADRQGSGQLEQARWHVMGALSALEPAT